MISADVVLKTTTILKEMMIMQLSSKSDQIVVLKIDLKGGRGQKLWKNADALNGWPPAGDDENLAVITDVCSTLCKIYDTMSWTLLTLIIT